MFPFVTRANLINNPGEIPGLDAIPDRKIDIISGAIFFAYFQPSFPIINISAISHIYSVFDVYITD